MEVDGSDDFPFQLGDFLGSIIYCNFQGWCNPPKQKSQSCASDFWPLGRAWDRSPYLGSCPILRSMCHRRSAPKRCWHRWRNQRRCHRRSWNRWQQWWKRWRIPCPRRLSGVWNWKNNKISGEMRIMVRQNLGIRGIIISHLWGFVWTIQYIYIHIMECH